MARIKFNELAKQTMTPESIARSRKAAIKEIAAMELAELRDTLRAYDQSKANTTAFYDALPDEMVQEEAAWGQVGAAGLAALTQSDADETHSSSAFSSDNVRS